MLALQLIARNLEIHGETMRLIPSDPDVETLVSRINSGEIDLQPDFQRGEVWSKSKKQRLIDSILRDWHVPPIHVIEDNYNGRLEVLDGQQRLAAIRDFVAGDFALDGNLDPGDSDLVDMHGLKYKDLPYIYRRRFNHFSIRLFRVVDYRAGEPGELFFRLNQPTSLTGAEQRNAFYGPIRSQIKDLVARLENNNLDKRFLGFSNSRMAYDDVLSRVAFTIDRRSLEVKITSGDLAELYRSEDPLGYRAVGCVEHIIDMFSDVERKGYPPIRFNKATLATWMIFIARCIIHNVQWMKADTLLDFMHYFEIRSKSFDYPEGEVVGRLSSEHLFYLYHSRSSSRVSDVSSVMIRDAVVWLLFVDYVYRTRLPQDFYFFDLDGLVECFVARGSGRGLEDDDMIARNLISFGWGQIL